MRVRSTIVPALLFAATATAAEPAATRLDLNTYLQRVLDGNPDLAAARAGVDVAGAQIDVAKVFPDPEVTAGLTQLELTHEGNPAVAGLQLSVPIELGGKRSARIRVAKAGRSAATFDYDEAVRALRAAASDAFVDALHARLVVAQKQGALETLEKLVSANEHRLAAGDISEAALLQSRVEAEQFKAEVLAAEGDRKSADVALAQLLGANAEAAFAGLEPEGDLAIAPPKLELSPLLSALEKRPDVKAAATRVEAADKQIDLAHANRVVDITAGAGWQHNFPVAGSPGLNRAEFLTASLSVPIPFSRIYRGELDAARAARRQAQSQLEAARVKAQGELRTAMASLDAATRRVAIYDGGTLANAKTVLEKTLYNYNRGGATLVEVLVAERTASDVDLAYLDALADRAHALIAVAQAAGAPDLVRF